MNKEKIRDFMTDFNEMDTVDFFYNEANENYIHLKEKLRNFISIDIVMVSILGSWFSNIENVLNRVEKIHLILVIILIFIVIGSKITLAFLGLHSYFPDFDNFYNEFNYIYEVLLENKLEEYSSDNKYTKLSEQEKKEKAILEIKDKSNRKIMIEIIKGKMSIIRKRNENYKYCIRFLNFSILCTGLLLMSIISLMITEKEDKKVAFWIFAVPIIIFFIASSVDYSINEIKFRKKFNN